MQVGQGGIKERNRAGNARVRRVFLFGCYHWSMCGRVTQSDRDLPGFVTVDMDETVDSRARRVRYNGAPSQDFWVIRRHPETGATLPTFRTAYAKRRCLVPVDSFFEWRKAKPRQAKQPYAIAMNDGSPFALAGIWENWKHPETGDYVRTFCIITCPANDLVATIHDRMPVILPRDCYDRWLSPLEPDPRDLLAPFPAKRLRIWPISTRVNAPANNHPGILEPV